MVDVFGQNVLHLSASARKQDLTIVNLYLKLGLNIDTDAYESNLIALHACAIHNRFEIAELLIKRGADTNLADRYGHTALHESAGHGHLKIVELMLENGADINAVNNDNRTALHFSAEMGRYEIFKLLVEKGANFDVHDKRGKTALELCNSWYKNCYAEIIHEYKEKRGRKENIQNLKL